MNWDQVEGNWKQFKGKVKEQWGKLTDDNLDVISGKRDQLAGKIQESYGISKEEAESQIEQWERHQKDLYPRDHPTDRWMSGKAQIDLAGDEDSDPPSSRWGEKAEMDLEGDDDTDLPGKKRR